MPRKFVNPFAPLRPREVFSSSFDTLPAMRLTTIATPRKCIDLESGVCSGAPLLGAGLVGVLAAGPARLALVPIAGGEGRIADLAIDKVQELAMLSRDVAVVRDADHALWVIIDPFGAMRVKHIARDVRALAMRPWGESAVLLHLDGSATALTLNRQEVGARKLTVRGTLRACDVGENVTFVVLDGEGGGQLRIHPGATPELGTSARTTLPREAAELDRLRGGTGLSALLKRGAPALCVITGNPSKLSAKLVQLDAKPADVTVIEDCLVVAFVDGRVALYDAETLARAGDAPMTATSVVTLAARGKPRMVLATAKESPALWIVTTAGELLCAPLGRETTAAEVEVSGPFEIRPAETEREPDAALAAELAARREALTDTAGAREAAEERARALGAAAEESERAQAAATEERAQLVATHATAIEELRAASVVALTTRVELEAERAAAAAADTAARARIAASEEESARLAVEHALAIEAVRSEAGRVLEDQSAVHRLALDERSAAHAHALDAREREREEAHAELEAIRVHLANAEVARAALGSELDTATAERDAARMDLESARTGAVDTEERARALEAELATRTAERDALRAEVERAEGELAAERSKLEKDSLKWGEHRISLEGAREKVGSVLSQARSVFLKRPRE